MSRATERVALILVSWSVVLVIAWIVAALTRLGFRGAVAVVVIAFVVNAVVIAFEDRE